MQCVHHRIQIIPDMANDGDSIVCCIAAGGVVGVVIAISYTTRFIHRRRQDGNDGRIRAQGPKKCTTQRDVKIKTEKNPTTLLSDRPAAANTEQRL